MNDMSRPADPVSVRRTFAIISHPDAGKTTLTEKLLLFGGAIQLAGEVKAKRNRAGTRSDWMKIERERGISVVTSVMTFEYAGHVFNLLDTPGHEDFSEDTYRTLTAVDSAVMVIDAAKGIEARTRKLFEVCRLRDIPIVTFINKMDRETRDPFELLDEIEKTLALDTAPVTWPIGRGRDFAGTYDLRNNTYAPPRRREDADAGQRAGRPGVCRRCFEKRRRRLARGGRAGARRLQALRSHGLPRRAPDAGLLRQRAAQFRRRDLIDALGEIAPPPRAQEAGGSHRRGRRAKMTGFVFKIQANMDPNHRDRIAFMRVCSGRLQRGMKARSSCAPASRSPLRAAVLLRAGPRSPTKPMPAMSSAFPTTGRCASATR
jgi:peptide chain release factor 3